MFDLADLSLDKFKSLVYPLVENWLEVFATSFLASFLLLLVSRLTR